MPFQPGYAGWGGILFLATQVSVETSGLGLPLLAACCAIGSLRGALDFGVGPTRVEIGLLVFLLVWILACLVGIDPGRSLALSMPLWATVLLVVAVGRETAARGAVGAMLIAIAGLSVVWSIDLLGRLLDPEASTPPFRAVEQGIGAWLVVPNDFAFVVLLWPAWMRMADAFVHRRAVLAIVGLLIALQLVVIWLLQSRLGMLLALGAGYLVVPHRLPASVRRLALGVAIVVGAWIVILKTPDSMLVRFELWRAAAAIFADHPWIGVGPHNFAGVYLGYLDPSALALDPRVAPWPHNLVFEIAAEIGLIGCCAFIALITCAAPMGRAGAASPTLKGIGVLFVILCLLEASTLRAWWWALLGIALAASNRHGIDLHATIAPTEPAPGARSLPHGSDRARRIRGE